MIPCLFIYIFFYNTLFKDQCLTVIITTRLQCISKDKPYLSFISALYSLLETEARNACTHWGSTDRPAFRALKHRGLVLVSKGFTVHQHNTGDTAPKIHYESIILTQKQTSYGTNVSMNVSCWYKCKLLVPFTTLKGSAKNMSKLSNMIGPKSCPSFKSSFEYKLMKDESITNCAY